MPKVKPIEPKMRPTLGGEEEGGIAMGTYVGAGYRRMAQLLVSESDVPKFEKHPVPEGVPIDTVNVAVRVPEHVPRENLPGFGWASKRPTWVEKVPTDKAWIDTVAGVGSHPGNWQPGVMF